MPGQISASGDRLIATGGVHGASALAIGAPAVAIGASAVAIGAPPKKPELLLGVTLIEAPVTEQGSGVTVPIRLQSVRVPAATALQPVQSALLRSVTVLVPGVTLHRPMQSENVFYIAELPAGVGVLYIVVTEPPVPVTALLPRKSVA